MNQDDDNLESLEDENYQQELIIEKCKNTLESLSGEAGQRNIEVIKLRQANAKLLEDLERLSTQYLSEKVEDAKELKKYQAVLLENDQLRQSKDLLLKDWISPN